MAIEHHTLRRDSTDAVEGGNGLFEKRLVVRRMVPHCNRKRWVVGRCLGRDARHLGALMIGTLRAIGTIGGS